MEHARAGSDVEGRVEIQSDKQSGTRIDVWASIKSVPKLLADRPVALSTASATRGGY